MLLRDLEGFSEPDAPGFGAEPNAHSAMLPENEARAPRGIGPNEATRPLKAGRAAQKLGTCKLAGRGSEWRTGAVLRSSPFSRVPRALPRRASSGLKT